MPGVRGGAAVFEDYAAGDVGPVFVGADTVIMLDLPRSHCLARVVRRWMQYRNQTRPDMGGGCPERLDWGFLRWVSHEVQQFLDGVGGAGDLQGCR